MSKSTNDGFNPVCTTQDDPQLYP